MEFICNLAEYCNIDCFADLAQYRGKEGVWSKSFNWKAAEKMSTFLWWKGICGSSQLSKVALRVLTAPCTFAATESSFSTQAFIHSAKRNRLTSERAAKITFLSYNWNLLHKSKEKKSCFTEGNGEGSLDKFCDASQDDISRNYMQKDIESSLTECELEDIEPVASTSGQTNDIEFINIKHVYDTDSD
ncbi:unnamed protein product [Diatraea saccharalis]|uniref:HAT C-terminal dimerisation domain-containing protein n=1 Tax=Diatraea saccharalis TaxID=40085 RepID=A0A9N9R636_9NEOP|nr:unnamed protein product [Diatraea saccharalis]